MTEPGYIHSFSKKEQDRLLKQALFLEPYFYPKIELSVRSRMIDRSFLKESRFGVVVLLQFGDRGDMPEILLWDVVIIEVKILLQGGFQVTGGGEGGGFQHLGDAR